MAFILGLDLGTRSVRGALLKTSLRALETECYFEVPFANLTVGPPTDATVQAAVAELLASLPSTPDAVVAAMDGARVSLRRVKIPEAARKRAQEVLPFELDALLPFPIDEAVVDFQEVEVRDGQIDLLAAGVPEAAVAEVLQHLAAVGINPNELAVGAAALDGLLARVSPPDGEAWMLLDVGLDHSDVCMVRNGACELARTLDEGVATLRTSPETFRHRLAQTVMKYRADGGPALSRVVVLGECTEEDQVAEWVGEALGIETDLLALPPARGTTTVPAALFGKAWALGARMSRRGKRLDFRRGKFAMLRDVNLLREHAVLAILCALALVVSYVFSIWAQYRVVSEERDALAVQLGHLTERHFGAPTESPKRARELLEGGSGPGDPLPRYDAFRALAALSAAVPTSVLHDTRKLEIQLDEGGQTGKFQLDGKLPDLTARDQIADALESNECFSELERGRTSTAPGEDRKTYVLEGLIACPGSMPQGKGKGKGKGTKRGAKP